MTGSVNMLSPDGRRFYAGKGNVEVQAFPSAAAAVASVTARATAAERAERDDWADGGLPAATERLASGDKRPEVLKAIAAGEEAGARFAPTPRPRYRIDYVGAVPSVPHYVAGEHRHMRRRVKVASEGAPVRVFVDITSSGGVRPKDVAARAGGIVGVLATVMRERPVQLYAVTGLQPEGRCTTIIYYPVPVGDPSLLCAAFSCAIARSFVREAEKAMVGYRVNWAFGIHPTSEETVARMRDRLAPLLGLERQDVYISGMHLKDPADTAKWLAAKLDTR